MARTSRILGGRTPSSAKGPLYVIGACMTTLLLVASFVGGAAATTVSGGMKGSPQPETASFNVGSTGSTGTGAVLPDGTIVLASPGKNSATLKVCMLHPGDRACAATSTLEPHANDSFYGPTEVVATGGTDVSVVAYDCCNIGNNGVVVFDSTNDGASFSPYVEAGDAYSVGGAVLINGQIVIVGADPHTGTQVQQFAPKPDAPATTIANVSTDTNSDTAIADYKGGVLVSNDDTTNSHVYYAPAGSDFSANSSYKKVATITNELTMAASGNALLTDVGGSISGDVRLRFFNGTGFGPAYKIPQPKNYLDGYFTMQEIKGRVHIFFLDRRAGYDLFSESTTDGVHWSAMQQYGAEVQTGAPASVLGPSGAGLVFCSDGTPLTGQPILNAQHVKVSLKSSRITAGKSTTLNGTVTPKLAGQLVTLQRLSGGEWYNVTTTHESSTGTFSFTVPGITRTYRAMVRNKPGYYLYGYSNAVTLTAVTT